MPFLVESKLGSLRSFSQGPHRTLLCYCGSSDPQVQGRAFNITSLICFSQNNHQCKHCLVVYWDYLGDLVYLSNVASLLRLSALKMQLSTTS